jgi:hypothetical protein
MKLNKKELQIKVAAAQIIGTKDFGNGISRVAYHSVELNDLLAGLWDGGFADKIMKAWYKGYDLANLYGSR